LNIEGIPTILFYPRYRKESPLKYDWPRDEESLYNYLKKFSSFSWNDVEILKTFKFEFENPDTTESEKGDDSTNKEESSSKIEDL